MKHLHTFESFLNEGQRNAKEKIMIAAIAEQLAGQLADEGYTKAEAEKWFAESGVQEIDTIIEGMSDDPKFIGVDLSGEDILEEVKTAIMQMKDVFS